MLNLIRENVSKYDVEIYAYCIMPNHFHLLIRADLKELASFMAKILAKFAIYYNKKHNRVGYVFQGRYKSQCVEDIGYFWNCLRYIHRNPMCMTELKNFTEYQYSSMKELYYSEKDILPDTIFQFVNERFESLEEFLEFHEFESWDDFEDIEEEVMVNRVRIALELLHEYEIEYKTEGIEILDYCETRQKYKNELGKLLVVSMKEAERLVELVKQEIEGTR